MARTRHPGVLPRIDRHLGADGAYRPFLLPVSTRRDLTTATRKFEGTVRCGMVPVIRERMAAEIDGEYVVYVNGIRLNELRALPRYLHASLEAGRMFRRLEADPDSGFLGYLPAYMGLRSGAAIQYWRSLEDIRRFAHDPDGPHVPAWRWYNEEGGTDGGLGFWAELYVVKDGSFETFYRNVPPTGLGEHGSLVPMADHRRRLGLSDGSASRPPSADAGDDHPRSAR